LPDARTIRGWFKNWQPDESTTWTIQDVQDPADACLVLEVLAHEYARASIRRRTRGQQDGELQPAMPRKAFTVLEAEWIIRVRKAAPGLPPRASWRMAQQYLSARQRGDSFHDIDVVMAIVSQLMKYTTDFDELLYTATDLVEADGLSQSWFFILDALMDEDADLWNSALELYRTQGGKE
jgi:hypothetical protein